VAAGLALLDRIDEAQAALAELKRLNPDLAFVERNFRRLYTDPRRSTTSWTACARPASSRPLHKRPISGRAASGGRAAAAHDDGGTRERSACPWADERKSITATAGWLRFAGRIAVLAAGLTGRCAGVRILKGARRAIGEPREYARVDLRAHSGGGLLRIRGQ
jgi:hypothetical protein